MILFTTMVLAVRIFDALFIFSLWNASDNIPNDLLNQIWALPQRCESSFSAVHKKLFSLSFSSVIISDNAVLYLPLKSRERQSNYFLLRHTYRKEKKQFYQLQLGNTNARKLFLHFESCVTLTVGAFQQIGFIFLELCSCCRNLQLSNTGGI